MSELVIVATTLGMPLAAALLKSTSRVDDFAALILIALAFVSCATTDLALIAASWMLVDFVLSMWRAARVDSASTHSPLMPLRMISVLLVFSILMLATRHGETDLMAVVLAVRQDDRLDALQAQSGFVVLLGAAIAMRCGMFPASLWLSRITTCHSPEALIGLAVIAMPGLALALRLQGLWAHVPDAGFLMAALGALTTLLAGVTACSVSHRQDGSHRTEVSVWCALVLLGQGLIGIGTGSEAGHNASGVIGAIALPMLVLINADRCRLSGRASIIRWLQAGLVLSIASGLWGQAAALDAAQSLALSGTDREVLGFKNSAAYLAVWIAGMLAQGLLGFAMWPSPRFTAGVGAKESESTGPKQSGGSETVPRTRPIFALAFAALSLTALIVWAIYAGWPLRLTAACPAGWLGCLMGELVRRSFPKVGEKLSDLTAPIARLARRGWYVEEGVQLSLVLPLRGIGWVLEQLDRHLLGQARDGAWSDPATRLTEFIDEARQVRGWLSMGPVFWAAIALLILLLME